MPNDAAILHQLDALRSAATAAASGQSNDISIPPEFADEGLALRFSDRYRDRLRYVAAWGRWLIWDGSVWRFDDTMRAFDLARGICREAAAECDKDSVASSVASAKTVAAVERLAKADRRHAATVDQWDSDPWLLNTPNGVVDLRTGDMRPHDPNDYMTKITAVAPGGECPLWLQFLARITGENADLQDFLMRAAGYCLTGITREHALFFGYGTGANGKGTFLNTLTAILAGYAVVAPMETFTASPNDRHPTDLAMLRGARLVAAQETEEGRRWAESRIKALTGGDPITARFMRMDFFTFVPLFKLFIAGNHKPGLRGVDEAIRRRLNLIPFTVTIPVEERDQRLAEKLQAEMRGILAWAIEGCLLWQKIGLAAPAAVVSATDDYIAAEDALSLWLEDRCRAIGYGGTESSVLYASWRSWASAAGEEPGSQKRFSQALEAKGLR
jgi:putative DNA primase/helicase